MRRRSSRSYKGGGFTLNQYQDQEKPPPYSNQDPENQPPPYDGKETKIQ